MLVPVPHWGTGEQAVRSHSRRGDSATVTTSTPCPSRAINHEVSWWGFPARILGPFQAPSPAAASLGTSLGTSPQSYPFPVTPPSALWVPGLLQLPHLGDLSWFREVLRTEGQHERAMGYPSMSHLTIPWGWFYTKGKSAPQHRQSHSSVTCLSPPWHDSGHDHQASEGTQHLGALVT